jgi:hypothetical protein
MQFASSYLIAVYAGNSVPVIGIGLLTAATASLVAHEVFVGVITVGSCRADRRPEVLARARWIAFDSAVDFDGGRQLAGFSRF